MLGDLQTTFFGRVDSKACIYFFVLSVFFLVLMVVGTLMEIRYIIRNYGQLQFRTALAGVVMLFNAFLAYFVNRILFNMCKNSL